MSLPAGILRATRIAERELDFQQRALRQIERTIRTAPDGPAMRNQITARALAIQSVYALTARLHDLQGVSESAQDPTRIALEQWRSQMVRDNDRLRLQVEERFRQEEAERRARVLADLADQAAMAQGRDLTALPGSRTLSRARAEFNAALAQGLEREQLRRENRAAQDEAQATLVGRGQRKRAQQKKKNLPPVLNTQHKRKISFD